MFHGNINTIKENPDFILGLQQGQPVLVPVNAQANSQYLVPLGLEHSRVARTVDVTQAQMDSMVASKALTLGCIYLVNGAPLMATSSTTYTSMDGDSLATSNETVLCIGASAVARTNSIWGVDGNSITILNNVVTLTTSGSSITSRVGDVLRLETKNTPQIECFFKITSRAASGGGVKFTGAIQNVQLPNYTGFASGIVDVCETQHWSAAAGWPSMLQTALAGRVRCVAMGISGSFASDWNNPYRYAQIAQFGKVGAIILEVLGNSVKSGLQTADSILQDVETLVQFCRRYARVVYVVTASTVSMENTASPSNTRITANTSAYTTSSLENMGLAELPKKYPFVRIVPTFNTEAENFGNSAYYTDWAINVQNGFARKEAKADDGVHNMWNGMTAWALTMAQFMQLDFPYTAAESVTAGNNYITTSVADLPGATGQRFVMNLFENTLYGTVANTGGIPNAFSGTATGVSGWTVSNAPVLNPDGGSDWITTCYTNGNAGGVTTAVSQQYFGTGNSLKTQLNSALNQGCDIDIYFHGGVYGFVDGTLQFVEVVLEGDTGDGQGVVPIASGYSTMGNFQAGSMTYADGSRPSMSGGFWGIVRFPRFQVPVGTVFSQVYIRQTARPRATLDPVQIIMRCGAGSVILARR